MITGFELDGDLECNRVATPGLRRLDRGRESCLGGPDRREGVLPGGLGGGRWRRGGLGGGLVSRGGLGGVTVSHGQGDVGRVPRPGCCKFSRRRSCIAPGTQGFLSWSSTGGDLDLDAPGHLVFKILDGIDVRKVGVFVLLRFTRCCPVALDFKPRTIEEVKAGGDSPGPLFL